MKICKICGETDQDKFYTTIRNLECKVCNQQKKKSKRESILGDSENFARKNYRTKEKKLKYCKICGETDQDKFYTTTGNYKCKSCLIKINSLKPRIVSSIPKYCKICGETDQDKFYKTMSNLKCKVCISKHSLNIYFNNVENILNFKKDKSSYNNKNSLQMENIFRTRLKQAEKRAKKVNREFSIDEHFLKELYNKQSGKCYYSGLPLTTEGDWVSTLSLERVDSTKGYTKDNTVLVCAIANSMKRDLEKTEFFKYIEAIYHHSIVNNIL